tara:strand:+ start:9597 stop:11876 length:2280 start_codon:yes stop_codon:yes gene_type:complete
MPRYSATNTLVNNTSSGSVIKTQNTDLKFSQPGVCGDTSFADLNYAQNDNQYMFDDYVDADVDVDLINYSHSQNGILGGYTADATFYSDDRFIFDFPEIPIGRPDNNVSNVTINAEIEWDSNIGDSLTVLPYATPGGTVPQDFNSFGTTAWTGSNNVISSKNTKTSMSFTATPGNLSSSESTLPIRLIFQFVGETSTLYNHLSSFSNSVKIHSITMTITYTGKTALTTRFIPCDTAEIKWLGNGQNNTNVGGVQYATGDSSGRTNEEVVRHVEFNWNASTFENLPGLSDFAMSRVNVLEFINQPNTSNSTYNTASSTPDYRYNVEEVPMNTSNAAYRPDMINDYEVFQGGTSIGRASILSQFYSNRRWMPEKGSLKWPRATGSGGISDFTSTIGGGPVAKAVRGDLDVPRPNFLAFDQNWKANGYETLEQPTHLSGVAQTQTFATPDWYNIASVWKFRHQLQPFTINYAKSPVEFEYLYPTEIEAAVGHPAERSEAQLKFPGNIKAFVQFTYIPLVPGISSMTTTSTFSHGLLGVEHRLSSSDVGTTHKISATISTNGGIRQDGVANISTSATMAVDGGIILPGISAKLWNASLTAAANPIVSPLATSTLSTSFTTSIVGNVHYKESQTEVGIKAFAFTTTINPTLIIDVEPATQSFAFTMDPITGSSVLTEPTKYRQLVLGSFTRIATAAQQTRSAAVNSDNRTYVHPADSRSITVDGQITSIGISGWNAPTFSKFYKWNSTSYEEHRVIKQKGNLDD